MAVVEQVKILIKIRTSCNNLLTMFTTNSTYLTRVSVKSQLPTYLDESVWSWVENKKQIKREETFNFVLKVLQ